MPLMRDFELVNVKKSANLVVLTDIISGIFDLSKIENKDRHCRLCCSRDKKIPKQIIPSVFK